MFGIEGLRLIGIAGGPIFALIAGFSAVNQDYIIGIFAIGIGVVEIIMTLPIFQKSFMLTDG